MKNATVCKNINNGQFILDPVVLFTTIQNKRTFFPHQCNLFVNSEFSALPQSSVYSYYNCCNHCVPRSIFVATMIHLYFFILMNRKFRKTTLYCYFKTIECIYIYGTNIWTVVFM